LNFPVGTVILKGEIPYDVLSTAQQIYDKRFSGYLIQSVRGNYIEEGALFFREGEMIACIVECVGVKRTLKGTEAMEFFFNQTRGKGFFQCVELTRSQVDLVTAFDEKLLADKIALKELPKFIPSVFSPKFERAEGKVDALEAYGLGELK
jgi:hypothetical protein